MRTHHFLLIAGFYCALVLGHAQTITIAGSETVRPIAEKWSLLYKRQDPKIDVRVVGGGSSSGFAALQSQQAQIAQSSRRINSAEMEKIQASGGGRVREVPIATDAVVFYVHASNPITSLTLAQLQDILSGTVRNWRAVGGPNLPITLHGQNRNSGTRQFVKETLLGDRDFASGSPEHPNYNIALSRLAEDQGGITYAGLGFGRKYKTIAIRSQGEVVKPTPDNIRSKRYPITRQLFLYAVESSPAVKEFLRWVTTAKGQIAVEAAGFLPLSSAERSSE
jgi:phosphate transport system substrate-binding protein